MVFDFSEVKEIGEISSIRVHTRPAKRARLGMPYRPRIREKYAV
jgi:hypothetical protein